MKIIKTHTGKIYVDRDKNLEFKTQIMKKQKRDLRNILENGSCGKRHINNNRGIFIIPINSFYNMFGNRYVNRYERDSLGKA